MMTKTELMAIVATGRTREAFTHSILGTFDITAMRRLGAGLGRLINVPLDQIVGHIRENRVIEDERIDDLDERSWKHDPGIMLVEYSVKRGQFEHTMVDGHHRALRREREGLDSMDFWEVEVAKAIRPPADWGPKAEYDWGDALIDGKIVKRATP